jgi:tetratricopeptide (TPR) repeat protein
MSRLHVALLLLVAAAGCGQTQGCAQGSGDSSGGDARPSGATSGAPGLCPCEPGSSPVVDPKLIAFLSKARSAHHEADLAEQLDDRRRAIKVLEQIVQGPRPPLAPEVVEVLADTYARIADLRSGLGDFDAARHDVDGGLELAVTPTHFRGHLFEMKGVIEERRAKALAEKGDAAGAEKAKQAAIQAFQQAIEIQDEVISKALGDAGSP